MGAGGSWIRRRAAYDAPMFAVVWHYWIGVALILGVVGTLGMLAVGYLKSVESTRYPKGR
jgi:hypothetical protein